MGACGRIGFDGSFGGRLGVEAPLSDAPSDSNDLESTGADIPMDGSITDEAATDAGGTVLIDMSTDSSMDMVDAGSTDTPTENAEPSPEPPADAMSPDATLDGIVPVDGGVGTGLFLRDTFTDPDGTELQWHNPDVGVWGSWSVQGGPTQLAILQNNAVTPGSVGMPVVYRNVTDPPSADYFFGAIVRFAQSNGSSVILRLRVQNNGSFYEASVDPTGAVAVRIVARRTETSRTTCLAPVVVGSYGRFELQASGSAIAVFYDSNELAGCASSDTQNTSPGRVEFELLAESLATDVVLDDVAAGEL